MKILMIILTRNANEVIQVKLINDFQKENLFLKKKI